MRTGQEGAAPRRKCHSARTLVGSGHALAWTEPASFCPCPFLLTAPLSPSRGSCQGGRPGGGAGWPPHPRTILSLWGPATEVPMKGQGPQRKRGWERVRGVTTGNLGCREEAWVLSLLPRGTRGEAVLGVCFCFHREGRQDEMGEGSETEWCFS